MLRLLAFYLLHSFVFVKGNDMVHPLNYEAHLRNMLFSNWTDINMQSMPGKMYTTEVIFGINVTHIKHLDYFKGLLTVNAILHMQWENPQLTWNKTTYGGIETINLGVEYMWHPDIYVYNSVSGSEMMKRGSSKAQVWHTGTIKWKVQVTLRTFCAMDVRHFPFDEQECSLKFGSWTKDGLALDLKLHSKMKQEVILQEQDKHFNEWEVTETELVRHSVTYACCPEPYLDIMYTLHLKRHSNFYWHTLLAPLLMTMAITLTMFWLPPSAGEKFLLAGINLTVLIILLTQLHWVIPRNTKIPVLVAVTGCVYFFMALSLVVSVATSALAYRKDIIPALLDRHLKGRLGTVLCLPASSVQLADATDQEMTSDWSLVAVAVNRISFVFFLIAMIVLFALTVS